MSKLPTIGSSIFTEMSKLANQYQAINLAQGFPNFPIDERLAFWIQQKVKENVHQYSPMEGNQELLFQIEKITFENYQRKVTVQDNLLITSGATQGIYTAITALVNAQEEVIILDPSYDSYVTPILLCQAIPIRIPLKDDFTPDFNRIENGITPKTRMIILNNPHNPSGKIWTEKEFEQLESLLEKYPNIIILSDEVYEYITFENSHISINTRPKLRDKSIIISSFGKSLHVTGWKIGYMVAPKYLLEEIKKTHQFIVFTVNSLCQAAIAEYLKETDLNSIKNVYRQKRDLFRQYLSKTRFQLLPCEGTYFQVVNYSEISTKNDMDFCNFLIKKIGVAAIPISCFYETGKNKQLIRFCYAKDDKTLIQATNKMINL